MILVIGLGNPGEKFENTRHNAGFVALDFFAKHHSFVDFKMVKKHNALVSEKDDVMLVKPQTFMNESGKAVKKITTHYKLPTTNLVVVHDEIDLLLGKFKITKDSGSGGHKGVDSIISHLGTKDFIRFKIGVCPEKGKPTSVETFVIKKFTKEEKDILDPIIAKTADALDFFIKNGLERAMNEYNR